MRNADLERYGLQLEDLPDWMQPHQRGLDYPLLVVLLLCALIALPWIDRPGLPNAPATNEYLARMAQVADNMQQGAIYPRWATRFHYSYGSPLFNYLAPAPHYIGGLHYLLAQTTPPTSFKSLMVIAIFMAGVGMFGFVRRRWGVLAGLLAAMLYLTAPPMLYTFPYVLGDLSLMLAAGIFPCLLWSLDRTLHTADGRDISLTAALTALLIGADTLMGWVFLGLAVGWLLWIVIRRQSPQRPVAAWGALLLGLGLMGFYWLPALAEWGAVRWHPLEIGIRPLSLSEVVRFPSGADDNALHPLPTGEIGLGTWGLALLGALIYIWKLGRNPGTSQGLFPFVVAAPVLLLMATQLPSAWLDDSAKFPALSRLDLLLPVTACACIVAGQAARAVEIYITNGLIKWASAGLLVLVAVGSAYPVINPPNFVFYRYEDALAAHTQAELQGHINGSLLTGQLLPRETPALPIPSYSLLDGYAQGVVNRADRATLLPRLDVSVLSYAPTRDEWQVSINREISLRFLTLYYRGWEADFGGQPMDISVAAETGLIEVTLPEGTGVFTLRLSNTRIRTLSIAVSLGCLVLLFPLMTFLRRPQTYTRLEILSPRITLALAMGLLALGMIAGVRANPPTYDALRSMERYPLVFEGGLDFLGYDVASQSMTLYWQPNRLNLPDYHILLTLREAESGRIAFQEQHQRPGGWPVSTWNNQHYSADRYWFRLPPGAYTAEIEVLRCQPGVYPYACESTRPLSSFNLRGEFVGERVSLPVRIR